MLKTFTSAGNLYLSFDNVPDVVLLCCIVNRKDPVMEGPLPFPDGEGVTLRANLPIPSILLIHVCAKPSAVPGQVSVCYTTVRCLLHHCKVCVTPL